MTVRQALQELTNAGLVDRQRGKGTFVASGPMHRRAGVFLSFSDEMAWRGKVAGSQVVAAGVAPARPEEVDELGLEPGAEVVRVERVRLADGVPIAFEDAAVLVEHRAVLDADLGSGSLHQALEALGIVATSASGTVTARTVRRAEAALLDVPVRSALLVELRLLFDQHGRPFERTETALRRRPLRHRRPPRPPLRPRTVRTIAPDRVTSSGQNGLAPRARRRWRRPPGRGRRGRSRTSRGGRGRSGGRTAARIGPSRSAPAAATPPPITTRSGTRMVITLAMATPRWSATVSIAAAARSSPAAAAANTASTVGCPARAASAPDVATASRQPRLPQPHRGPSLTTIWWASSPARPWRPKCSAAVDDDAAADARAEHEAGDGGRAGGGTEPTPRRA